MEWGQWRGGSIDSARFDGPGAVVLELLILFLEPVFGVVDIKRLPDSKLTINGATESISLIYQL
jgi:hypothetical protein